MINHDFNDGFEKGRRAARKGAGWVAGLGAAAFGPTLERAGEAIVQSIAKREEVQRQLLLAQQKIIAEGQRQQLLSQKKIVDDERLRVVTNQRWHQEQAWVLTQAIIDAPFRPMTRYDGLFMLLFAIAFAAIGTLFDTNNRCAVEIAASCLGFMIGRAVSRFFRSGTLRSAQVALELHNNPDSVVRWGALAIVFYFLCVIGFLSALSK